MIHPTNPAAVRAVREGGKGWHWVYPFDPAVHVRFDPFDHDGDGEKGGSLPGEQSTVAKGRRKKGA